MINLLLVAVGINGLYSCATIPGRAFAVKPFDKEKLPSQHIRLNPACLNSPMPKQYGWQT